MANEISNIKEIVFATYHGVIKNIAPRLLQTMANKYYTYYRPYIDVDRITAISSAEILAHVVHSTSRNPFERFMLDPEFNWKKAVVDLTDIKRDPLLYFDSEPLVMYRILDSMADDFTTGKIFVYSPLFDIRILKDLEILDNGRDKIEYITGGFVDAVKSIKGNITAFILNDVKFIEPLIEERLIRATNVLVANYGYQYKDDPKSPDLPMILDLSEDLDDIEKRELCRIRTFEISSEFHFIDMKREAYFERVENEIFGKETNENGQT